MTYLDLPADQEKSSIDHDARMLFDQLMSNMIARGAEAPDVLAALRRISRDGNGWRDK